MSEQKEPEKLVSAPANHEIQGFMPCRKEFDTEQENDAEMSIKDISFSEEDTPAEIELKLTMLEMYYERLCRRYEKRQFALERGFTDFKRVMKANYVHPRCNILKNHDQEKSAIS